MIRNRLFYILLVIVFATLTSGCAITRPCNGNKILIEGSTCDRIVSIVNNKSTPEKSKIQSYDLVCEDDDKENSDTFNVVFTRSGKIKDVQISDKARAMGRAYVFASSFSTICKEGQVERCITVCEFPIVGQPFCYYICVCTDN